MTKAALDAKAELMTRIQTVLRAAKAGRDLVKLREGADLMNGLAFQSLPFPAQVDLAELYAEANLAVTGALIG